MASRTSTKIDPIAVCVFALRQVKTKNDYMLICNANSQDVVEAAWQSLSDQDQQRIRLICDSTPQPDLNAISDEIIACGNRIQLQAVKATHGEDTVRAAWKLIPASDRLRLKALCQAEQQPQSEEVQPVTEQPAVYQVESQPKPKSRTLFSISDDLEKLNELLDECADDTEQKQLLEDWLEHLGDERDKKLDAYAALITEMQARAEVRKGEAKRLMELAAADENRAKLLKDRLKWFFETHNLKTLETSRYKLSLAKNGGKAPLVIDQSVLVSRIPERFQKVSVDFDTAAIRDALERGERLNFAQLGERGTSMRIK